MIIENTSPKLPKYVANILINPLGFWFLLLFNSATLINPHDVPSSNQVCDNFYPHL